MSMSKQQEDAAVGWLGKHSVHCPICDRIDFLYDKDFIQVSKLIGNPPVIVKDDTRYVGYTCRHCGFFWMVDARIAGIPKQ